ncbi:plant basic secretory protein [Auriculariales sp. MPI-PUGE-AT-0066]|nr:plant basic secretory protein [Auriculariales sp. MPI-PUGE-AT-0066]
MPPTPTGTEPWPVPPLHLRVVNLDTPGARKFFAHVNDPTAVFKAAVRDVFVWLYTQQSVPRHVRSVTIILRSMGGVAHTTGSELDNDHKEIHFSLDYIAGIPEDRAVSEIKGVLTHEMVHCFQFNGKGTCPGGLIEGIADYVRLRAGYVPPHWKQGGDRWDEGYQTTGYFLYYLERHHGEGFVRALNDKLRDSHYEEDIFKSITGHSVDTLWKRYKQWLEGEQDYVAEEKKEQ